MKIIKIFFKYFFLQYFLMKRGTEKQLQSCGWAALNKNINTLKDLFLPTWYLMVWSIKLQIFWTIAFYLCPELNQQSSKPSYELQQYKLSDFHLCTWWTLATTKLLLWLVAWFDSLSLCLKLCNYGNVSKMAWFYV